MGKLAKLIALGVLGAAALVMPGCGGGGIDIGSLIFVVQWNGLGPGSNDPGSVKVTLYRGETQAAQGVIPRTAGQPADTGEFGSLATGDYRLVAEAFVSSDGSGTAFAAVRETVSVSVGLPSTHVTSVGTAPTHAEVTPSTASIEVGETVQLNAVALDSLDSSVFTADGDWTWESLNEGVASVGDGLVTGIGAGTVEIRATHPEAGYDSASVKVTSIATQTKYTVLVFLNAANDLDYYSDVNVNQMEYAASNPQVRTVVQWKRISSESPPWTGTRRYLITHDTDPDVVASTMVQDLGAGVDMGSAQTLREFVDWGMANYPADHTVLVMWNHGSGWRMPMTGGTRGISFDWETGNHIETWELAQAIVYDPKVDILAWDACMMQMLEVAFEVQDVVDYSVGSEASPPGAGYPYDAIMSRLAADENMTPRGFTQVIVQETISAYGTSSGIAQSSIETAKLGALATAASSLADVLISKRDFFVTELGTARNAAEHYAYYEYKDLFDVCTQLSEKTGDQDIVNAALAVQAYVTQAVVEEAHGDQYPQSHGISICYPASSQYDSRYSQLAFAALTHWDEWLLVAP